MESGAAARGDAVLRGVTALYAFVLDTELALAVLGPCEKIPGIKPSTTSAGFCSGSAVSEADEGAG